MESYRRILEEDNPIVSYHINQSDRENGSTRGSCSVASCFPVQKHAVHMTFPEPEHVMHVVPSSIPDPMQLPHGRYPVPLQ